MTKDAADTKLEKMKAKIRSLLALAGDKAATEAEAAAAAEAATRLMMKWDLDPADIAEPEADEFAEVVVHVDPDMEEALWSVALAIEKLCFVEAFVKGRGNGKFRFFGETPDALVAEYLFGLCFRAIRDSYDREEREQGYKLYKWNIRYRKRKSFITGMSDRLAERIAELAWGRKRASGPGLVVSKEKKVKDGYTERFGGLPKTFDTRDRLMDEAAMLNGVLSAERVSLSRGLDDRSSSGERVIMLSAERRTS
jgi:hypothetical protein